MTQQRKMREVLLKWQGPNTMLVEDLETHDIYQIFLFRPRRREKGSSGVVCSDLCGHDLKRFHFSCLRCRMRRVALGKLPGLMHVTPYILLIRADRPMIVSFLLKNVLSIAEHLATW